MADFSDFATYGMNDMPHVVFSILLADGSEIPGRLEALRKIFTANLDGMSDEDMKQLENDAYQLSLFARAAACLTEVAMEHLEAITTKRRRKSSDAETPAVAVNGHDAAPDAVLAA